MYNIMYSIITCDLAHEAEGSFGVLFIIILSDPDVQLVLVASTVVVKELQALKLPPRCHPPTYHFGSISLFTRSCAVVHKETRTCKKHTSG